MVISRTKSGAAKDGGHLFVLSGREVVAYGPDAGETGRTTADETTRELASCDGVRALADQSRLVFLDTATLKTLGEIRVGLPARVTATRYGRARAAFFVEAEDSWRMYAIDRRGTIIVACDTGRSRVSP